MSEKVELNYNGQEASARKFLINLHGAEKVAMMSSSQVEKEVNPEIERSNYRVVYGDDGESIGLAPVKVFDRITWFTR